MARFKHLATLRTNCAARDERPYLALEHIESWTGTLIKGTELPVRAPSRAGMASVQPGDVLFGKLRPYLAKTWVVDRPALASTELMCMRPQAGVDSRWLGYSTLATPFVEWAVATSEGTKMPRTSWEKVGEYRPWVPSPSEQRAIADYLDTETSRIDTLITKKRHIIELLDERLAYAARALTTANGAVGPLRRFVHAVKTGTTPPAGRLSKLLGSDIGWYSPGDVGPNLQMLPPVRSLNSRALSGGWTPIFPADSTLIVGIGATAGRVGHNDSLSTGNQQMTCISPNAKVLPRFLSWQLWARTDELRETAPYTTLPILNNDFLRSTPIVVPSLKIQETVVTQLDRSADLLLEITRHLRTQLRLFNERRQSLITQALVGELAVPGVER